MRMTTVLSLSSLTLAVALLGGCTVTVKTQTKFVSSVPSTKTAAADYNGENIDVTNGNGELTIETDSSATKVSVSMVPFAFADEDKKSDAEKVQQQIVDAFSLSEGGGQITIKCNKASHGEGTAASGTSGCDKMVVKIPANKPVKITALADNGQLTVKGLTVADGAIANLKSDNGGVDATVTGGVNLECGNGDMKASLTPTKGSEVKLTTENGDIDLALPKDFAADAIAFSAGKGVTVEGFSDLKDTSVSRGEKGAGAKSIRVEASDLGTLKVTAR